MNDNDLIKEVRSASNIVDVISSYLPLVKKGKNYFGVCPFHDDNNPSMSVSEDKQIYKCFSCGASGNVFNFVMDYENISFMDALKKVSNLAGININIASNSKSSVDKDKILYEIIDVSKKLYKNTIYLLFVLRFAVFFVIIVTVVSFCGSENRIAAHIYYI